MKCPFSWWRNGLICLWGPTIKIVISKWSSIPYHFWNVVIRFDRAAQIYFRAASVSHVRPTYYGSGWDLVTMVEAGVYETFLLQSWILTVVMLHSTWFNSSPWWTPKRTRVTILIVALLRRHLIKTAPPSASLSFLSVSFTPQQAARVWLYKSSAVQTTKCANTTSYLC